MHRERADRRIGAGEKAEDDRAGKTAGANELGRFLGGDAMRWTVRGA